MDKIRGFLPAWEGHGSPLWPAAALCNSARPPRHGRSPEVGHLNAAPFPRRLDAKPEEKSASSAADGRLSAPVEPTPVLLLRWVGCYFRCWSIRRGSPQWIAASIGAPGAGGRTGPALIFYQKGYAAAREAWIFDEPQGSAGPPRVIQKVDCRASNTLTGEIRWTADGRAVYAAGRTPVKRGVPELRWLFEFDSPRSDERGRLFLSTPDLALPGRTAFVENSTALRPGGGSIRVPGRSPPRGMNWEPRDRIFSRGRPRGGKMPFRNRAEEAAGRWLAFFLRDRTAGR